MTNSKLVYPLNVPVGPRDGAASPADIGIASQDYFRKTFTLVREARKTGVCKDWMSAFCYTRTMYIMKRKFNAFGLSQSKDDFDDISGVFSDFLWKLAKMDDIQIGNTDAIVGMRVLLLYQRESEDVIGVPKMATLCTPGMYDLIDEDVPLFMDPRGDKNKAFALATSFTSYPQWF